MWFQPLSDLGIHDAAAGFFFGAPGSHVLFEEQRSGLKRRRKGVAAKPQKTCLESQVAKNNRPLQRKVAHNQWPNIL